jgi:proton-dependent oligopeptide transporter, POT family
MSEEQAQLSGGWLGHPAGLSTLFFTEMWERFRYYGMRAFLMIYMVTLPATGGLGLSDVKAGSIYGTYTFCAWGATIFGGLVADHFLGQYRSVLVGGIVIALGHFTLAFKDLTFFYVGLGLIAIGTGLLKANASTLVGSLYGPGDSRRDAGFSIFYMGINVGAFFGPIIAGFVAQRVDWHAGFALAGFGMIFGLIQYVRGKHKLQPALERLAARPKTPNASFRDLFRFTAGEWKQMAAVAVFFLFASIFWGAYEQAGSTLSLFAERYTRLSVLGFSFPSSWFQSVQPALVVFPLGPGFAWLWMRLGRREPSSPAKMAWGLAFIALAFVVLVPAARLAQSGSGVRVSPWWLVGVYFISELGEMCLSPVGLSVVTKLAPVRIVGLMMGVWFLSNAAGNGLAGFAATFFSSMPLTTLFGIVATVSLGAAVLLVLLLPAVRRLMGGIH